MIENKVMLTGRLTRKGDRHNFQGGGAVFTFSLAVPSSRVKNEQTGKWEDVPAFVDCKAFNSTHQNGRMLADTLEKFTDKGTQLLVEGRLVLERWQDKQSGQNRSALKVVVEDFKLLGQPKDKQQGGQGQGDQGGDDGQYQGDYEGGDDQGRGGGNKNQGDNRNQNQGGGGGGNRGQYGGGNAGGGGYQQPPNEDEGDIPF